MLSIYSISVFAASSNERDQLTGEAYSDYEKDFEVKGISFDEVKILQNLGYTYKEILDLWDSKNLSLYSSRSVRAVRPSNYVMVTNVAGSTEYYHPGTGMVAGDFYQDNNGTWIETKIRSFARDVYDTNANVSCMYYLFGEWDSVNLTHKGVDMRHTVIDPPIYSLHAGEVIAVGTTGRVAIYDGSVTHFYVHLDNIQVSVGNNVGVGTYLGDEGYAGTDIAHLHYEVRQGWTVYMGEKNNNLRSLSPYDYM